MFSVHALEKWRLQMMLARKYQFHQELVNAYKKLRFLLGTRGVGVGFELSVK